MNQPPVHANRHERRPGAESKARTHRARRGRGVRRLVGGHAFRAPLLVLVVASVLTLVTPARADAAVVTTFSGPNCTGGSQALLADWTGVLSTAGSVPVAGTRINMNTTASGYPAGSVYLQWASATGAGPTYGAFTPTGAGFPSQYAVPALELRSPTSSTSRPWSRGSCSGRSSRT